MDVSRFTKKYFDTNEEYPKDVYAKDEVLKDFRSSLGCNTLKLFLSRGIKG